MVVSFKPDISDYIYISSGIDRFENLRSDDISVIVRWGKKIKTSEGSLFEIGCEAYDSEKNLMSRIEFTPTHRLQ